MFGNSLAGLFSTSAGRMWIAMVGAVLIFAAMAVTWLVRTRRYATALRAKQDAEIESLRDEVWMLKEAAAARDRAEAASEAKSRFLATVSHEIRTPLSGILGLADLLSGGSLDGEQRAYVDAIKTSGGALASLIHEILDFSKIEAGRLDLVEEPFDLPGLVEGIVELLAPRAHGKGIEIASSVGADVPKRVRGDAARLRQVLMNLAGNAVKFTDAGGVGLTLERRADGRIRFAVADTGIGVPTANRNLIFDEFEQGDGSSTRRHAGTGLGLAISKRLVERMKGKIELESTEGRGSVFSFAIPLEEVEPAAERPDLHGLRVLLVAKSAFEAPFLAHNLEQAGAEVATVETTHAALERLNIRPRPDLVIVDCAVGEVGAGEIAMAARAAEVARSLILFSPFERRAFGQHALGSFDGWLVKPVRVASLFARLGGAARQEPQRLPRAAGTPVATGRGARVLLAEDDEINAMIALAFLARLGAATIHVRDGVTALARAEEALRGLRDPFDVIVMDVRMPGLDGMEVARRLRRAEAEIGAVPNRLIALTANVLPEDRRACLDAGFDVFLTKPVDLAALADAIIGAPDDASEEFAGGEIASPRRAAVRARS